MAIRLLASNTEASADAVLAVGEVGVDTATGLLRIGDGTSAWSGLTPVAPSGASGALPAAQPDFATETLTPDPATGTGSITVLVVPADQTALAIKVEGDAWPRWLILSDATDGIRLGDGTFDPYNGAGLGFYYGNWSGPAIRFDRMVANNDVEFTNQAHGPVLAAPDGTRYRLKVANDGTLSTEVVP